MSFLEQTKIRNKLKHPANEIGRVNSGMELVIRLPHPRTLRVVARSILLAVAIVSLPWVGTVMESYSSSKYAIARSPAFSTKEMFLLQTLLKEFKNIGLLKDGSRLLLMGFSQDMNALLHPILHKDNIDVISQEKSHNPPAIPDRPYDFVYALGLDEISFIDRILKLDGVAAIQLSADEPTTTDIPINYQVVYVHHFEPVVVAFSKIASTNEASTSFSARSGRRLLSAGPVWRRGSLDGLEDTFLEPPSSKQSRHHLQKIRYLPQLMDCSLDEYPRRIFIAIDPSSIGWFEHHYPVKSQAFEIYKVEIAEKCIVSGSTPLSISEWLQNNVNEQAYVVMQAGAEVVEEIVKSAAVSLVDELFLECNYQGTKGSRKTKRPYWECLSLYGKLRDAGVAVHQWWSD